MSPRFLLGLSACLVIGGCWIWQGDGRHDATLWRFHDTFETGFGIRYETQYARDDGAYTFRYGPGGDLHLALTVRHGMNPSGQASQLSERVELGTPKVSDSPEGSEIWMAFRVRKPAGFQYTGERTLFFQFKSNFRHGGDINPLFAMYVDQRRRHRFKICGGPFGGRDRCRDVYLSPGDPAFPLIRDDRWTNFVIRLRVDRRDGRLDVYKDGDLVYACSGPTFYEGLEHTDSWIKFGVYRNTAPTGRFPSQTLYFDDFTVGSRAYVTRRHPIDDVSGIDGLRRDRCDLQS